MNGHTQTLAPPDAVAPPAGVEEEATRTRVVLADDAVLLREGVARLLEDANCEIVGRCSTADDLLLKVRSYDPDVAIIDIRMPPGFGDEGLQAAKEIRERYPDTAVLLLSQYIEAGYALELLETSAEGVGYLLKDRVLDIPEFVAAVKRVATGGSALDPRVVAQLVGRRRSDNPLAELTESEHKVLELMAEGLSNAAIGERLFITESAVEKHVTNIFRKLRLPAEPATHRRVLAVLAYLRS
jgi:DNA-binding NarL/FixJ family response regulator